MPTTVALDGETGRALAAIPAVAVGLVTTGVAQYELLDVLGAGSTGTVHRGRHRDNGAVAAVKLLRLDAGGPEVFDRFRREARIVASLAHPGIVRVLDSGVDEVGGVALRYLVSEFVEGRPFDEALREAPLVDVLRSFVALCDAVAYAHRQGVLHRDLKPGNVLVDAAGHPHVLDFGCAGMLGGPPSASTVRGVVLGTPGFMSPEQACGALLDSRSDQWALAAMLFVTLTGRTPHDLAAPSSGSVLQRVAGTPPRKMASLRADLPVDLCAVVDKVLAVEPESRYGSVDEFAQDLRRWLAGDPVTARPPSFLRSLHAFHRRHRVGARIAALVAVVLIGGFFVATMSWRQARAAEVRLERGTAEALSAISSALVVASRLAETTTAAEQQLAMLSPALTATCDLRELAHGEPQRWLRVEAGLREVAGDLLRRLHRLDEARVHRERVLAIAEALRETDERDDAAFARALVKRGDLDRNIDDVSARRFYRSAHEILAETASRTGTLGARDDLGWSYHRLAGVEHDLGDQVAAHDLAKQHLDLAELLLRERPDPLRNYNLASALAHWRRFGGLSSGEEELRVRRYRVDCSQAAVDGEPESYAFRREAQTAWEELADLLAQQGSIDEADRAFAQVSRLTALRAGLDSQEGRETSSEYGRMLAVSALRILETAGIDAHAREVALGWALAAAERLRRDGAQEDLERLRATMFRLGIWRATDRASDSGR